MRLVSEITCPHHRDPDTLSTYRAHATRVAFNKLAASMLELVDKDAVVYDLVDGHNDSLPLCRVTVSLDVFSDEELRRHDELVIQKYIGGIQL